MTGLVFYTSTTTPREKLRGKNPGPYFKKMAHRFGDYHGIPDKNRHDIDCSKPYAARRGVVLEILRGISGDGGPVIESCAFVMHGWETGIQCGFKIKHIEELASALSMVCYSHVVIPLYACSTGEGDDDIEPGEHRGCGADNGFADRLRDACLLEYLNHAKIMGHDGPGRCTQNPRVVMFEGKGNTEPMRGGRWLFEPGTKYWKRWRFALRSTDLDLRFPFMTRSEIVEELERKEK